MRVKIEEARKIIQSQTKTLKAVPIKLIEALGMVVAKDIKARYPQPPFDRSPYDGYALRSLDSKGASKKKPIKLSLIGSSFAGSPTSSVVRQGEIIRIMTGGKIPEGADCVIKQEDTYQKGQEVSIFYELQSNENFIYAGEDYKEGEVLIKQGTLVDESVIAVAASAGYECITVIPFPKTGLLATGTELKDLGQELEVGQIYNSNSYYMAAKLKKMGIPFIDYGKVKDELKSLQTKLEEALSEVDFLITSGGVSVGEADYIPKILENLGAEILFKGVQMKPGMPVIFCKVGEKYLLACSGNPFAAIVNFEILGREIIAKLSGRDSLKMRVIYSFLKGGYKGKRPATRYIRVSLESGMAIALREQKNGQIKSLIEAEALAEIPDGREDIGEEEKIKLFLI